MLTILHQNRSPESWSGGDIIRQMKTIEELKKLGLKVDFSSELSPNLDGYDIVHLFNLCWDWTYKQFVNAYRQRKKIVISPIFHPNTAQLSAHNMVLEAQAIICQSKNEIIEMKKIYPNLGDPNYPTKFYAIENGIASIFGNNKEKFSLNNEDYVLCVGRIQETKNQHMLVKAMALGGFKNLVLIGDTDENYLPAVRDYPGLRMIIFPYMQQKELAKYYKGARVVAVPSLLETFNNTLLEALASGTPVIYTNKALGGKDLPVHLCDPYSSDSIVQALKEAWSDKIDEKWRKKFIADHKWKNKTKEIKGVYDKVMAG